MKQYLLYQKNLLDFWLFKPVIKKFIDLNL